MKIIKQNSLGAIFIGAALGFSISSYSDSATEIDASAGHVSVVHAGEGVMFETGPGGRIKVWEKVPASATGGTFEVIIEEHFAGFGGAPRNVHRHPESSETFYVIRGDYIWRLGDEVIEAGPGDFVHVPAETHHSLHTDTGGAVIMVYTPPGIVAKQEAMKALTPEQRGDRAIMRELNEKHGHVNVPNAE